MTAPEMGAPRAGVEAGTEAQREQKHPDFATAAPDRDLMLQAALEYAKAGMAVFPVAGVRPDGTCRCGKADCNNIGKHPHSMAHHGSKAATTDLETVRRWWRKDPHANIGIVPAKCNPALAVLDIDPRNGGNETRSELEKQHGPFSRLIECRSGGGGVHLWFKAPPNAQLPGKLGPGIDVQHHGYLVVPPSLHKSGRRYGWPDGRSLLDEFDREFLPPLPAWIADGRASSTTDAIVQSTIDLDPLAADGLRWRGTPADVARLKSALHFIDPNGSRDDYLTVLFGCHAAGGIELVEAIARPWARGDFHGIVCEKYSERGFDRDIRGIER